MTSKNQLLDPMGTLCRLILLNFEPISTKVSINNHTVQIQTPFNGQWFVRRFTGDGVSNIYVLFQVFQRVIEWYIIPLHHKKFGKKSQYDTKKKAIYSRSLSKNNIALIDNDQSQKINNDLENNKDDESKKEEDNNDQLHLIVNDNDVEQFWDNMVKLCNYVCSALSKLQYTYVKDNQLAVIALQYYINMIKEALDGRYDIEKLPQCIVESKHENLLDYNKIKKLWDVKKVCEICHIFDLSFSCQSKSEDSETKEVQKDIIEREKEKEKEKEKIKTYMNAINGLLNLSDNCFKELIKSSNSG